VSDRWSSGLGADGTGPGITGMSLLRTGKGQDTRGTGGKDFCQLGLGSSV